MALAQATRASGAMALRGFVAGVEAACRTGVLLGMGVLETPFHPTAIAGTIGAAAGGAVVLGLDDERFAAALGIAATQAAGLAAAVGTMCKPLHAGTAASAGALAARLAARGFTAPATALECRCGFSRRSHVARRCRRVRGEPRRVSHSRNAAQRTRRVRAGRRQHREHTRVAAHGGIRCGRRRRGAARTRAEFGARVRYRGAADRARSKVQRPHARRDGPLESRDRAPLELQRRAARDAEVGALRARISVEGRAELDVAESRATIVLRDGRVLECTSDERDADRDPQRRSRERARNSRR